MTNYDDQIAYDALNYVASLKRKKNDIDVKIENIRLNRFFFLRSSQKKKVSFLFLFFFLRGEKTNEGQSQEYLRKYMCNKES